MKATAADKGSLQLYRRLLRHILPYRGVFATAVIAMAVAAAMDVSFAALLKYFIEEYQPSYRPKPISRVIGHSQQIPEQLLSVPFQQRPRRVGARRDAARRTRGCRGFESAIEPVGVDPLGVRQHQRRLRVRGQGLVRAGNQCVRTRL